MTPPVALTIAGSDPSGGAGIQADLKTFHQFGVYGEAVITLLTVQNTQRVSRVETMPAALVAEQLAAVLEDIPPAAAKTGALGNGDVIEIVAAAATAFRFPLVVDPVMISKHGAPLLSRAAEDTMRMLLLPQATLVTPNIPEAEALTGLLIDGEAAMVRAARQLRTLGCRAVLLKGGHRDGEPVDILDYEDTVLRIPGKRIQTRRTHGTGCTYAAAITACLACGSALPDAVLRARRYIQAAIETAPELGRGQGPVNHFAVAAP